MDLRYLLVQIGLWIAALGGWTPPECGRVHLDLPRDLHERIQALTARYATTAVPGEAKRHQVYAQLLKEYPEMAHRDLGLALEIVLHGD